MLDPLRHIAFADPATVLRRMAAFGAYIDLEVAAGRATISPRVYSLRTSKLKPEREGRDGALFAYGMTLRTGIPMDIALGEEGDRDFLIRWRITDGEAVVQYACAVQHKELPPSHLNPDIALADVLDQVRKKYPQATETVLLVRLNRNGHFDPMTVNTAGIAFKEVWFLWHEGDAGWALWGPSMGSEPPFGFLYPDRELPGPDGVSETERWLRDVVAGIEWNDS